MDSKAIIARIRFWHPLEAIFLVAISCAAGAQSVSVSGIAGARALLVVDGRPPKFLGPGEVHAGVKLLQVQGEMAVVEINGQKASLRLGDAPVNVGTAPAPEAGQRIVLPVTSGGHFLAQGQINGRATQFLVDTGATAVSVSVDEAARLGLDYKSGRQIAVNTANGRAQAWQTKIASVRINGVEAREVDAIVTQAPMPFVLLGNSFLARFEMNRSNDQLVLLKRY